MFFYQSVFGLFLNPNLCGEHSKHSVTLMCTEHCDLSKAKQQA